MLEKLRNTIKGWAVRYDDWRCGLSEGQFAAIRSLVILGLLLALGGVAWITAGPAWRGWRHRQAMSQAIEYAERNDYRNTMLALKRATDLAPMDLATWKDVSEKLAELGSPQAIVARENVVRLAPGDMAMRLALVEEALRFGQVDIAHIALAGFDEAARGDAAFHRLAAALAMATGESENLERHLEALVNADPQDAVARFNLAAVRLWQPDKLGEEQALAELEELTRVSAARVRAGLELLKHAARIRDGDRVRVVVDLLNKRFGVRVSAAPVSPGDPPGWQAMLQGLRDTAAASDAADVALVARWLGDVRMGRDALVWIEGLPPELRQDSQVQRVAAGLSADLQDYDRLEPLLLAGALGPLPPDAVRLAVAAQVQRMRYQKSRGRGTWEDAITACGESVNALAGLASLAEIWTDTEGHERVLHEIIKRHSKAHWAYLALRNLYSAQGNAAKLWQLYGSWSQTRPDDPSFFRIWISLGMVLDRITPEVSRAAILRAEQPGASSLDKALGAALQIRANRREQAMELLEAIPLDDRVLPNIAFWRAFVLMEEPARADEAVAALAQARRPGLLQEEVLMLDMIERALRRH